MRSTRIERGVWHMRRALGLVLLLLSMASAVAGDHADKTAVEAKFAGVFLRTSPSGSMIFASFDVTNSGHEAVEFVGYEEAGRVYVDEAREATLQFRYPGNNQWEQEMASFQSRREPAGRLKVPTGATGRMFVRWSEINVVVRPEGTRYRYLIRDTKGREYVTEPFALQDESFPITTQGFLGGIAEAEKAGTQAEKGTDPGGRHACTHVVPNR